MGFKVGDRIKVHFANGIDNKGIVIDVNNDILRYKRDKCGNIYSAHTKQCRRLVKKKSETEKRHYCKCYFHENMVCNICYGGASESMQELRKRITVLESQLRALEKLYLNILDARRRFDG